MDYNEFKERHLVLLGRLVRIYMGIEQNSVRTDEKIGVATLDFVRMVQNEAMRDAREEKNK